MARLKIPITLIDKTVVNLIIAGDDVAIHEEEIGTAAENGESVYQLLEGASYEYAIDNSTYQLKEHSGIVLRSRLQDASGRITPNIYVGSLELTIIHTDTQEECGRTTVEVRAQKISYRSDYRTMLEYITERCVGLVLQHTSPVEQAFTPDFEADADTLYQRFAFIKSLINSEDFSDAIHKITSAPVTRWVEEETQQSLSSSRRITNKVARQIASATNRIALPDGHHFKDRFTSIPARVTTNYKRETADTPENRFIKHALQTFSVFCADFRVHAQHNIALANEALLLEEKMEQFLLHSVFREITAPKTLPLNSPVLQRKEGYREILRSWLMFDLAAKLIWHGGDDVYKGGKRDVAVLYEYWLFFKLLDLVSDVFNIKPADVKKLIEPTADRLGLKLKQGNYIPLTGIYTSETRRLNVQFSYNRSFSGNSEYPSKGSWTRTLRPDYTLSIWPAGISADEAEKEELIVHIHFDAKYKIDGWMKILGAEDNEEVNLDAEKEEQKKGTYKNADLMKMHTYRDAIRRTGGAYVIYPGTNEHQVNGFHEILPGIGAFGVNPSAANKGIEHIRAFLKEVVAHFLNRASQRENISLKTYQVYNSDQNEVNESLPEPYGDNRNLIPDDVHVLVGYYNSQEQLNWILGNGMYNVRTENARGSLRLGIGESSAKYLLLHAKGDLQGGILYKIEEQGPRIFSSEKLRSDNYLYQPSKPFYLIYRITVNIESELKNRKWDVTKLPGYAGGRGSALPFTVTLTQLMKALV